MKFKKIFLITLLLLTVLTIGTVSATDNEERDIDNLQNTDESIDSINLNEESAENTLNINENEEVVELNEQSSEIISNNEDNILTSQDNDVLGDSQSHSYKLTVKPAKVYSYKKFSYSAKLTDNGKPVSGIWLVLSINDASNGWTDYEARTNSNGIATFKLDSEPVGKYDISVEVDDEDIDDFVYADSYIKVIKNPKAQTKVKAPKITAKYKTKKYFKITVKNYKGKPIKKLKLTLDISTGKKWKIYYVKTNNKGVAKFNVKKLKPGTHKVFIYIENVHTKYDLEKEIKIIIKKKTSTKKTTTKKKSSYKTFTLKLKVNSNYYSQKKLKTGDVFLAAANSYARQHPKGIVMGTSGIDAGQEGQHSTKLLKAKVWYKNTQTGKTITKTKYATKNKRDIKKFSWISGYKPIKVKVWYKKA